MSNIWYLTQTWNVFVNKIWSEDSRLFLSGLRILYGEIIDEIIFISLICNTTCTDFENFEPDFFYLGVLF